MARSGTSQVPSNPTELAEAMANGTASFLGKDAATRQRNAQRFHEAYAAAANMADPGIEQQVRDQTEKTLIQFMKDNGMAQAKRPDLRPSEAGNSSRSSVTLYNERAVGAAVDNTFGSLGEYFHAITPGSVQSGDYNDKLNELRNSLGTQVPSEGGFLVPEVTRSMILTMALEQAVVRGRAMVIPMPSQRVPIPAVDETSHANSVFGGVVSYWTEEGAELTESQPQFGRIVLDAKKLTIYCEAPNELLADAPIAGAFLEIQLPRALAFDEDRAFLSGTGVGEPTGVLKGKAAVSVTRATSNEINWADDVLGMVARLLPSSLANAVWIAHPSTIPQLGKLSVLFDDGTDTVGGSVVGITNAAADMPMSILGRPLIFSEKVPSLGNAGDLSLIDFSHYLIGDRQTMTARASEHYKFQNDVTAFRVVERVDGRPWVQSPLTPAQGSDTLSPYVILGTS